MSRCRVGPNVRSWIIRLGRSSYSNRFVLKGALMFGEETEAFAKQYAWRAGIEGTLSNGVRSFDLRRTRYLGRVKTHLQHILIAASLNLMRVARWLAEEPLTQARSDAFVRLHQVAAA